MAFPPFVCWILALKLSMPTSKKPPIIFFMMLFQVFPISLTAPFSSFSYLGFLKDFAFQFLKILEHKSLENISLMREMHKRGINMRYLGRVYNALFTVGTGNFFDEEVIYAAQRLALIEACARVLKNKLNQALQEKMKEVQIIMFELLIFFF